LQSQFKKKFSAIYEVLVDRPRNIITCYKPDPYFLIINNNLTDLTIDHFNLTIDSWMMRKKILARKNAQVGNFLGMKE
jgi:hypothetical protein